jgi:hypothetical protein
MHPDITIALANDRIADHQQWAARQRLVASVRKPRRHLLQSLARLARRPVRPVEGTGLMPQPAPIA